MIAPTDPEELVRRLRAEALIDQPKLNLVSYLHDAADAIELLFWLYKEAKYWEDRWEPSFIDGSV